MSEGIVSSATGTRARPPVWVWPSIALGLLYPALAQSARLDVELLRRLPDPPPALRRLPDPWTLMLLGVTVLTAVLFSLLRVGVTNIYSESMVFLLLALAIGMLSPAAGLLLVLLHIPFDLFAASRSFYGELDPFLPALAGRAVSWWLLWLLVVAIPLMARALPGATLASGQPADPKVRRALAYLAGAVAAGVLLFMWVGAAPFLLRPPFTWSELSFPTVPAIQPIQGTGIFIILAGVAFVLGVTWLRDRFDVLEQEAVELNDPDQLDDIDSEPLVSDQIEFVGRIVAHVLAVLLLGGLVTGAFDAALFFGAALLGQLIGTRLTTRTPLGALLARIPWFMRFLAGFALTYVIGLLISNITFEPAPALSSEFFPVVLTVGIGLAIFQVLLNASPPAAAIDEPPDADEDTQPVVLNTTGGASTIAGAALILAATAWLAFPGVAAADNCSSWGDACPATVDAAAAAGAGAAAVVAVGAALAASRLGGERRRARRPRRRRAPDTAAAGTAVAGGSGLGRVVDRALRNYGTSRTPPVIEGEMKLGDVGPAEGKAEMKLGDVGPAEGKAEMKLGDVGPAEGKAEMKLGDVGPAEGKAEMKLGDVGPAEGKEMKLGDVGPAEGKEMKLGDVGPAEDKAAGFDGEPPRRP